MHEFKVEPGRKLTPDQVVRSCMGIGLDQLVQEIIENKDGKYDSLYRKQEHPDTEK